MNWDANRDEEAIRNYNNLKVKLEQTIKKVKNTANHRDAKGLLIEVQNEFKGLKLIRENREELYNKLQAEFLILNKKIEDERTSYENEAALNYLKLKNEVDEAVFIAYNPKSFKESWDFLIEIQSDFKGARLHPDQRNELYARLQDAFAKLKEYQDRGPAIDETEALNNYKHLKVETEEAVSLAESTDDIGQAMGTLIKVQEDLKNSVLMRDQRDELHDKIQEAFRKVKAKKEELSISISIESESNYNEFKPKAEELLDVAKGTTDFHNVRESLKDLQHEIRESQLLRPQKEELYAILQEAFEILHTNQNKDQETFEQESTLNYSKLKAMVEEGYKHAETSTEYKETREFLKKIQSEFKGIKLKREEREQLYARLQLAFEILTKRVDDFFRYKKKNWELKMNFKITEMETLTYTLKEEIEKDEEYLEELNDQLDIVIMANKGGNIIDGLKSRISSTKLSIQRKENEIASHQRELESLKKRMETEE